MDYGGDHGGGGHGGDHGDFGHGGHGDFGHAAHHEFGGGHTGHGDYMHESITFAFAHSHGHGSAHFDFEHGHCHGGPHPIQVIHLGLGREGAPLTQAQIEEILQHAPLRTFLVHVVSHGPVNQMNRFYHMATELGLIRLDDAQPNFDTVQERKPFLAGWNAWSEPKNKSNMPAGYLPGPAVGQVGDKVEIKSSSTWIPGKIVAVLPGGYRVSVDVGERTVSTSADEIRFVGLTGTTAFYRQYWQIGKVVGPLWNRRLIPDKNASTFIEVSAVLWSYKETADYETKITVRVVSRPIWDSERGAWGFKREPFLLHQRLAEHISTTLFNMLKRIPPSDTSMLLRKWWISRLPEPPEHGPHDEGVQPASPDEERDLQVAQVREESRTDEQSRIDAGHIRDSGEEAEEEAAAVAPKKRSAGKDKGGSGADMESLLPRAQMPPPAIPPQSNIVEIEIPD